MIQDEIEPTEFWHGLGTHLLAKGIDYGMQAPQVRYVHFDDIVSGYKMCAAYSTTTPKMIKVELLASRGLSDPVLQGLIADAETIDQEIGHQAHLCWVLGLKTDKKVQLFKYGVEPLVGDQTPYYEWITSKLELMHEVFAPRIVRLKSEQSVNDSP